MATSAEVTLNGGLGSGNLFNSGTFPQVNTKYTISIYESYDYGWSTYPPLNLTQK